ncbi:MAG: serine/threonine protein kinase [Gammaproteobacteria bacterium]|jgi:serine/threonine protein kinase
MGEVHRKARATIGRFTVTRKIGSGGQGSVYLAEDPQLKRAVAIKLIDKESICGELRAGELPNEALMAARLQHPNIVAIHDVGHYHQRPYLVFEFAKGHTFRKILHDAQPIAAQRALVYMRSVLEGMSHAHERDVLHLDLNPGNILLNERDVAQIMDFGLARLSNAIVDVTSAVVGTLRYIAPEQLEERAPTAQTDVRSLGLILYEMLTGCSAIRARSIHTAAQEILNQDIDLALIDAIDNMAPISEFLLGALARDPDQRYDNATQMLSAFDTASKAHDALKTANDEPARGTVEFLLRRMQRREDFPALSGSLVEINRLTGENSNATTALLANVVLRDYALTNKLLKLANSAFYGALVSEVKNISHAIGLIGFEQLRITANSLTLFSHIKDRGKSNALSEMLIRSFVAGLLARHLAQRQKLKGAEEAFICGMFQSLGETLTMFYFVEEHQDIEDERHKGQISSAQAAKSVLGITYAQLGAAIAREWRFPAPIVNAIEGVEEDIEVPVPANDGELLRNISCFADRLCQILGHGYAASSGVEAMHALQMQFRHSLNLEPGLLPNLASAALDRLDQHATILGIDSKRSTWCKAARQCIENSEHLQRTSESDEDLRQAHAVA